MKRLLEVMDMFTTLTVVTVSWVYTFVNLSKLAKLFTLSIYNLVCQLYLNEAVKKVDRGEEEGNPFKNICIQCYFKSGFQRAMFNMLNTCKIQTFSCKCHFLKR